MINQYVAKLTGTYIGAYIGEHTPPEGAVEVPVAPEDARQVWNFDANKWGDVPAVVPESVTMRQARRALLADNLYAQANAAIQSLEGPAGEAARIDWEFAQDVRRDDPLVLQLGAALGLTDEQVDNLFISAALIE